MEKNLKKDRQIDGCITESLCCTLETNKIVNELYFNFKKEEKNNCGEKGDLEGRLLAVARQRNKSKRWVIEQ